MKLQILPLIGRVRLSKLRPAHGAASPRGGGILRQHGDGVELDDGQPGAVGEPPRVERAQPVIPTVEQLPDLMTAARGTVLETPIILPTTTAMRRSDCSVCTVGDVDLKRGRVGRPPGDR